MWWGNLKRWPCGISPWSLLLYCYATRRLHYTTTTAILLLDARLNRWLGGISPRFTRGRAERNWSQKPWGRGRAPGPVTWVLRQGIIPTRPIPTYGLERDQTMPYPAL